MELQKIWNGKIVWLTGLSKPAIEKKIEEVTSLGGPQEKMWFFKIPPKPLLSALNCSTIYQYDILKIWLKKNWPFLANEPPKVSIFSRGSLLTKMLTKSTIFQKSEKLLLVVHFKYVKLFLYIFERKVQSFGTKFWHQVGQHDRYSGGGHPLTKKPIYLVFLRACITSDNYSYRA